MQIEKASKIGFCFGVRRALDMLEKVAVERGGAETLGEVVHNDQVLQKLAQKGVRVAHSIEDIRGNTVVLGAHGVTPQTLTDLKTRKLTVVDTTCPFVKRAQIAARRLSGAGFYVVVFGDVNHPEIKGVLGCTDGKSIATLDASTLSSKDLPRRLGILSQTTQIPGHFKKFVTQIFDMAYIKDSEIRVIDTICHDIRDRQAATIDLAKKVDLMLVIGGRNSANTSHLADLSSSVVETLKIETADELCPEWFKNRKVVGVTGGASTAEDTIDEIMCRLGKIDS